MTKIADIDDLSKELRCEVDEKTREATLDYFEDLQAVYRRISEDEPSESNLELDTPHGERSDDPYNALLEIYETPRRRTDSGPLAGLRVAVKDNIASTGLRMTCGLRSMFYTPSFDAVVVERLLDRGGTLLGKTNMDAFAFGPAGQWSEFGTVENPRDPNRVPGGSSSGSGAAVAGGLVDIALGTDTGGSIRSPAACCGIVGIRPTHGLVPRYGMVELAPSADTIGPIARDVETAAIALEAIAGADVRDRTSVPVPASCFERKDDLTVGIVRSTVDRSTPPVAECVEEAIDSMTASDEISVEDVDIAFGEVSKAFSICLGAEFAWLVRQSFTVRGEGTQYNPEFGRELADVTFNGHVASRILPGALLDEETDGHAYALARREVESFNRRLARLFETVDVLLTPTLRVLPPKYGEVRSSKDGLNYTFTKPFSLTGGPVVSVPVGSREGLPVSAQLVAPPFRDGRAIQVARVLESVTPPVD